MKLNLKEIDLRDLSGDEDYADLANLLHEDRKNRVTKYFLYLCKKAGYKKVDISNWHSKRVYNYYVIDQECITASPTRSIDRRTGVFRNDFPNLDCRDALGWVIEKVNNRYFRNDINNQIVTVAPNRALNLGTYILDKKKRWIKKD